MWTVLLIIAILLGVGAIYLRGVARGMRAQAKQYEDLAKAAKVERVKHMLYQEKGSYEELYKRYHDEVPEAFSSFDHPFDDVPF